MWISRNILSKQCIPDVRYILNGQNNAPLRNYIFSAAGIFVSISIYLSSIAPYSPTVVIRHRDIRSYTAILQLQGCQIRQPLKNGEFTIGSIQKWRIYNAACR